MLARGLLLLLRTPEQVNMVIIPRRTRQHHAMRMEGRGRDGRLAVRRVQETGIGLGAREELALQVEDFDLVCAGSADFMISKERKGRGRWDGLTQQILVDVHARSRSSVYRSSSGTYSTPRTFANPRV